MQIMRGLDGLPIEAKATAVTVGFFDGVHRGHQAVIGRTVEVARSRGLVPLALTFDRHPREVFAPGTEPRLLTTLERKATLIAGLGIDTMVVLEFNEELAAWPPERFVDDVLVEGLHIAHAVVGSNFTFGYKGAGNLATLADLGALNGFDVEGVALMKLAGRPISSSSVRAALGEGDLVWPRDALGRRFVLDGTVVAGAGRGAGMGYPTANLEVSPRMQLPGEGIYAGRAFAGGETHAAAIDVGTNPTFGGEPLHAEAFLLDFEGDLQGDPIAVEFWERLRDEQRFDSPQALAAQIAEDVERTRALVAHETEIKLQG
jgi:riboflavin kinase/FMN adenylyltransferase